MAIRDDLIRRRDALESVAGLADTMSVCVSTDECRGMMRMKMCALSAINEVPAAAPRGEKTESKVEREWISVADAMPAVNRAVLVCNDYYGGADGGDELLGICTDAVYTDGKFVSAWDRKAEIHHVTHWMPLPKPPREG